jgi:hypothetical protein
MQTGPSVDQSECKYFTKRACEERNAASLVPNPFGAARHLEQAVAFDRLARQCGKRDAYLMINVTC